MCSSLLHKSNFELTLPGEDSELAAQIAKDPYAFDFLGLSGRVAEREHVWLRMSADVPGQTPDREVAMIDLPSGS